MSYGNNFRQHIKTHDIVPCLGVYDAFSASIAANYFPALFLSGFGFAAGFYGLPDIGFITWSDMAAYIQRVRTLLPAHHLLVDMDDGYGDPEVACHAARLFEAAGASGIVLEDQQRPRRCGHVDGKQIMPMEQYVDKLERVLAARRDLVVVARTDASDVDDILRRAHAFEKAGADLVLVDGVRDWEMVRLVRREIRCPMVFNQIAGGKSPRAGMDELCDIGIDVVIYSTPCLFAAHAAIEDAVVALTRNGGILPDVGEHGIGVKRSTAFLTENLSRRYSEPEEGSTSDVERLPKAA